MAVIALGVTVAVGLVALMLTTGEKKIEQTIARLYDADDPQFNRAMGVLLGSASIEGNRFEVLLNGDETFPSMLSAIRDAKKTITFESYICRRGYAVLCRYTQRQAASDVLASHGARKPQERAENGADAVAIARRAGRCNGPQTKPTRVPARHTAAGKRCTEIGGRGA